ncbi:MAG: hypothetical protein E7191_04690 [Erysipelotrichaceae bacterium]|nr:hypothetical protein [Erysipelotrichaceae bacterium]MBR3694440.1 hypothetical protein [Erysipelotrichales bacterium]
MNNQINQNNNQKRNESLNRNQNQLQKQSEENRKNQQRFDMEMANELGARYNEEVEENWFNLEDNNRQKDNDKQRQQNVRQNNTLRK